MQKKPLAEILPHIVFANNDPEECEDLKEALFMLHKDFRISCMFSGKEVLHLLREESKAPDIILWHLHGPYSHDSQFLQAIKRKRKVKDVPLIIFSTSENANSRDYCFKTAPVDYFMRALSFLL